MAAPKSPRKGSLQYWPRKRAESFLPSVNWSAIKGGKNFKGFIVYKAGMISGFVKDSTSDSLTKDKKIIVPLTVLECPPIKIMSIRFYKNNQVFVEILSENLDKELKKVLKLPKNGVLSPKVQGNAPKNSERTELKEPTMVEKRKNKRLDEIKTSDYDDIRVIVYSEVKKTNIKKTPDLIEIAVAGNSVDEKLNLIKEKLGKEISISEVFEKNQLVDVRGLTKGKGLVGPVKRFGITLKAHKSEKGRRRPGSLGPWHPARVTFRVAQAGQLGMFTRVTYNNKILEIGKADGKFNSIKNFGDIKTDYILVKGSVQGPAKRQLLLTPALRPTKKQLKKNFELLEMR